MSRILTLKEFPDLKAIINKAIPSYRRHRVIVIEAESVSLDGGYWDGGSRSEYFSLHCNGTRATLNYPTDPPQFGGGDPPDVATGGGIAIVHGGVFCGKTATLTLYIHPEDISRFGASIRVYGVPAP